MRYVNMQKKLREIEGWPPGPLEHLKLLERKQTPEKWKADLEKAERELYNLPPGKTHSDIIKKYSYLWSDVKEYYREINHGKCWYCETKMDRMRGDIDHYRPKASVTQNPAHPGYWWLAFEWRNWRFCCEICNSKLADYETGLVGGKGSEFPLVGGDESRRVYAKCDYEDLGIEDPELLDPTEPDDPELLTFTSEGKAEPITNDETSIEYQRVKTSIRVYHLDHFRLKRERRTLHYEVLKHAAQYRKYDARWKADRTNSEARTLAKEAYATLRALIATEAEYSAAARAYLKERRKDNPEEWGWVDRLLTAP